MESSEMNPAYVHPAEDDEPSETTDSERFTGENAFDRLWRSFDGIVTVNWFDRDAQHFSFWFRLGGRIYRLPISRGLNVSVFRGSRKDPEAIPIIDWGLVWAEGDVLYVRVKYAEKLVRLFSGPPLENLKVVIERTDRKPRQKVACRVISAGHAPPF